MGSAEGWDHLSSSSEALEVIVDSSRLPCYCGQPSGTLTPTIVGASLPFPVWALDARCQLRRSVLQPKSPLHLSPPLPPMPLCPLWPSKPCFIYAHPYRDTHTHTRTHTYTLSSLRRACAVALGWASGQRARFRWECFLDEGPCWSGFCHLSFSLGGRKGGNSGCGWWEWGGGVKWGRGVNRRDAMAIWHQACSLLLFQCSLLDFSSSPLVQAAASSLFDLMIKYSSIYFIWHHWTAKEDKVTLVLMESQSFTANLCCSFLLNSWSRWGPKI